MTDRADLDIALIDRYLRGDIEAFNDLMEAHEGRVFAICLRMLRDREAALDATQDTFLTVLRKVDRYKATAAFSTWLYRVTVNTCYDYLRRQKRKQADRLPETHDVPDPSSQDEFDAIDVRQQIEEALDDLNPEFKAAIVLVDLQGMSIEQASGALQVPTGTTKSRLFRARKQLSQSLGNLRPSSEHRSEDSGEL